VFIIFLPAGIYGSLRDAVTRLARPARFAGGLS